MSSYRLGFDFHYLNNVQITRYIISAHNPNVWCVQTSLCLCVVSLVGLQAAPRPRVRRTAALASLPSLQQAVAAIPDGAGKYALALPVIGGCESA